MTNFQASQRHRAGWASRTATTLGLALFVLAGVTGIDYAMLIVAADDGPMPQTREHLAILNFLDIPDGVVVLTKIDRVEPDRITEVRGEIEMLVAGTCLDGADILPVSPISSFTNRSWA